MASCWKARHRACGTVVRFTRACQEKKVYDTQKVAVTMAEARHTKACLTVEALPTTEPHERVIDVQRQKNGGECRTVSEAAYVQGERVSQTSRYCRGPEGSWEPA